MRPKKNALSLHTSFHPPPPDHLPDTITITTANTTHAYDSPTTTTTASPSQSPSSSSPLRRLYHSTSNRFSLGPRSDTTTTTTSTDDPTTPSRSHSPLRLSSILRRPSLVLLRRRPSKVDMALSAERTRCDGDAIERQGLDLMEPRPVDPIAVPMDSMANSLFTPGGLGFGGDRSSTQSWQSGGSTASRVSQPRFVMGGIFEVMEGRA